MKKWYQSKTILLAIAQAIFGVLMVFSQEYPELKDVGVIAIIKSVLDIYIRMETTSAVQNTPVDNQDEFID